MASKIDNQQLQKMLDSASPETRKAVLSMLNENQELSSLCDELLLEDYKEIPVDIDTFIDDDRYMGLAWKDSEGNSKMYPYWREILKKLFPTNLTTSVNNFIATGARGLGKSEICILIMCYLMYRIMCLKNPLEYYHLKPTEKIVFAITNIKLDLAEDIAKDKFQKSIQLSPWFMARGSVTGRTDLVWAPNDEYHIQIIIGSKADDVLGLPVFFLFADEINFIMNQDIDKQKERAINIIDTAIGGMKTRFLHNGKNPTLLCLASSKRSEQSFLESHIKTKLKSEKENVLIVDEPVWKIKPDGYFSKKTFKVAVGNKYLVSHVLENGADEQEYINKGYHMIYPPIDLKADFEDDIDRALCDFAGISSTELSKYISGAAVNECINKDRANPFAKDVIIVGEGDDVQYSDFFDMNKVDKKMMSKPLFIHLDMSTTGDMTGLAGVWIAGKRPSSDPNNQSKDLYFELAFSVSIKAPKGHRISFEKHRIFINWLKQQGFKIKQITTDTFQSATIQQELISQGYNCSILSVDRVDTQSRVCLPYQFFKNVIYEKRIDLYESSRLKQELTNLERNINNGKVDHPSGGCFTGDTRVFLCDRSLTFEELLKEFNNGVENHILSINRNNHKIQVDKIVNVCLTKHNAELIQVELNNGEKIRCTPDHRFMLVDETFCEAQNLGVGQELKSLTVWDNKITSKETFKVISIIKLNEREDVYDLTTESNHNFLLSSGVFVHNSKDVADAACGSLYTASQHAEEYAYDYGENIDLTTTVTQGQTDDVALQYLNDFSESLKNTFDPFANYNPSSQTQGSNNQPADPGPAVIQNDILIW